MKVTFDKYNVIFDMEDSKNERSRLLGYSVYEMRCNKCLSFIEVQKRPEDLIANYCGQCGSKLKNEEVVAPIESHPLTTAAIHAMHKLSTCIKPMFPTQKS